MLIPDSLRAGFWGLVHENLWRGFPLAWSYTGAAHKKRLTRSLLMRPFPVVLDAAFSVQQFSPTTFRACGLGRYF